MTLVPGVSAVAARPRPRWRAALPALLRRPGVATPRVMTTTTGALFLSAGVTGLVAALAVPDLLDHPRLLVVNCTAAVVTGAAVLLAGPRLRAPAMHPLIAAGSLLAAVGIVVAGREAAVAAALLLVFPAMSCFCFSWVGTAAQLTWLVLAGVLGLVHTGVRGGISFLLLSTVLTVAVAVCWLIRLADRAEIDALTGLLNRRGLDRVLAEEVEFATRRGVPLAVALLDLDHFKQVNDTLGHAAGDQLLVGVGGAIRAAAGRRRAFARLGGDEFALVLPGSDAGEARHLLTRVRSALPVGATASTGFVVVAGPATGSAAGVLARADAALYSAKAAGRDRIEAAPAAVPAA